MRRRPFATFLITLGIDELTSRFHALTYTLSAITFQAPLDHFAEAPAYS